MNWKYDRRKLDLVEKKKGKILYPEWMISKEYRAIPYNYGFGHELLEYIGIDEGFKKELEDGKLESSSVEKWEISHTSWNLYFIKVLPFYYNVFQ